MAKKRMETAKINMLEAMAKNKEKRAHRLKMTLNRLDKRVASLVNEVEDRVEIEKELGGGTLALGGDGAPFGKDDTACAWLVSILNIGRVLSSNENFLLFGADYKEDCVPVKRFMNILMKDISRIENTTYTIAYKGSSVQAKFFVSELPNDTKMLAFLGGELNNSAKYYSSFADVTAHDHRNAKGTFGMEKNCTWKPWEYAKGLEVAAEVVKMKAKVSKESSKMVQ
ncbi:Hypothetical predicted protein [Paramuricea clavata]|uniref:Uncharacterized protein n=1 Tax=Paramuricea clavata TaxID=317549 RepID=A0A6S7FHD7_PARCT|nr:Hypothetical predicted protein [Paramuricea clavata]